jgi:transcriptional regulator with XRE-family HTH domain
LQSLHEKGSPRAPKHPARTRRLTVGAQLSARRNQDEQIRGKLATALKIEAVSQRTRSAEDAARILQVEIGTLNKYVNGDMIPGGQVLWRACEQLGLVLDKRGLRPAIGRARGSKALEGGDQYELPFINESVGGKKVNCHVRRKDSQYVQVQLRIKLAA